MATDVMGTGMIRDMRSADAGLDQTVADAGQVLPALPGVELKFAAGDD